MSFNLVVTLVKIIVPLSHFTHLPSLSHLPCFRFCLVFTFALFTIASVFCSAVLWCTTTNQARPRPCTNHDELTDGRRTKEGTNQQTNDDELCNVFAMFDCCNWPERNFFWWLGDNQGARRAPKQKIGEKTQGPNFELKKDTRREPSWGHYY